MKSEFLCWKNKIQKLAYIKQKRKLPE